MNPTSSNYLWSRWSAEVYRLLVAHGFERDFFGFDDLQYLARMRKTPQDVLQHARDITARAARREARMTQAADPKALASSDRPLCRDVSPEALQVIEVLADVAPSLCFALYVGNVCALRVENGRWFVPSATPGIERAGS